MGDLLDVEAYDGSPITPGPDDMVLVRFGELADLEMQLTASRESVSEALADIAGIAVALGLKLPPCGSHDATQLHIVPKIKALMATQGLVHAAEHELRERASSLRLPEIDLGGGRKAQLAGRKIPPEQLRGR